MEVTRYCSSFNGKMGGQIIKDYYLNDGSISALLKYERRRVTYDDRKLSFLPRQLKERPPTMQHFSCDELIL